MNLARQIRRKMLIAALSVAGFWLVSVLALYTFQGRIIFPMPASATLPILSGAAVLRLPSPQGDVIATYFAAPPGAMTAVFFHGNGEELANTEDWVQQMHRNGLGVLSVEYPGYGLARASGPPSEAGCYRAAEVALAHLHGPLAVPIERTLLMGHSLGSAVAAEMALRGLGSRLVLLSPITSIGDEAAKLLWWMPARLLVRHRFDTLSKAPRIALPTLIVHGRKDQVAPFEMGEQLAAAFPSAKLVEVKRGDHFILSTRLEKLAVCVATFGRGDPCVWF